MALQRTEAVVDTLPIAPVMMELALPDQAWTRECSCSQPLWASVTNKLWIKLCAPGRTGVSSELAKLSPSRKQATQRAARFTHHASSHPMTANILAAQPWRTKRRKLLSKLFTTAVGNLLAQAVDKQLRRRRDRAVKW